MSMPSEEHRLALSNGRVIVIVSPVHGLRFGLEESFCYPKGIAPVELNDSLR